jgi:hypothetical protein
MEHMREQVWAWRCEWCSHKWLASGTEAPNQCPKCKKRKWHTKNQSAIDPIPEPGNELKLMYTTPITSSFDGLKMNSAFKQFLAHQNLQEKPKSEEDVLVTRCAYTEYDEQTGETMACGLPTHSMKQRHGGWIKAS